MRLQDRVAIVTGGGDGIGRSIALTYSREGAKVVITGRRGNRLEETREQVLSQSPHAVVVTHPGDVSSESHSVGLVRAAFERFGRIDILVNNAGIIGPTAPVDKIKTEEWDEVLAVNLRGPFMLCREVVPLMLKEDRGCIINIASIAGRIAYPTRSPYAASKWGLIGLSRALALELGTTRIRVNSVLPGAVMGERLATIIQNFGRIIQDEKEPRLKAALSHVRASKLVSPDEIASLCLFLASDEAASISGQEIAVAGVTG